MSDPTGENPYAAPTPAPELDRRAWVDPEAPDLRLLAQWERRRIAYNVVLVLEVVILATFEAWTLFLEVRFWDLLVVGALGANLCFCAGPVTEAYLRWMGMRGRWIGPALFLLGTIVAAGLTFVSVLLYRFPGPI